jgi:dipeptide/tripeptide permease
MPDATQPGPPSASLTELLLVGIVGLLATAARLADDPPRTLARAAWLLTAGLGLATGGWLLAQAAGLDGWPALASAWVFGAIGSEAALPFVRRLLDKRSPPA